MVRMMGTFDNWISQRDSEFISIVKCIDELASKNDSTIKATISYLFENLLTANLYIDSGLRLTLVNNTGLLDLETPNEILTAIFSDIPHTFINVCKSLPHGVSHKYAKYYIEKAELLINETHSEPPLTDNSRLAQQLQATIARLTAENNKLKEQLEQQVKDKQKTIDQQAGQIQYLKNQLEQQVNQLSSAADDIKESTYQLINAMKDLLLDPYITQSLFVDKDNQNAKQKPTQGMLAKHIESMNIRGLAERNINGIFAEANKIKK